MIQGAAIQTPPTSSATGKAVGLTTAVARIAAPPISTEAIIRRYSARSPAPAPPASRAVVHSSRCRRLTAIRQVVRTMASSAAAARCAAVVSRRPSCVT